MLRFIFALFELINPIYLRRFRFNLLYRRNIYFYHSCSIFAGKIALVNVALMLCWQAIADIRRLVDEMRWGGDGGRSLGLDKQPLSIKLCCWHFRHHEWSPFFSLAIQSRVHCQYLERNFIRNTYTLNVFQMWCSSWCSSFDSRMNAIRYWKSWTNKPSRRIIPQIVVLIPVCIYKSVPSICWGVLWILRHTRFNNCPSFKIKSLRLTGHHINIITLYDINNTQYVNDRHFLYEHIFSNIHSLYGQKVFSWSKCSNTYLVNFNNNNKKRRRIRKATFGATSSRWPEHK